jgi:hypothetical protein
MQTQGAIKQIASNPKGVDMPQFHPFDPHGDSGEVQTERAFLEGADAEEYLLVLELTLQQIEELLFRGEENEGDQCG